MSTEAKCAVCRLAAHASIHEQYMLDPTPGRGMIEKSSGNWHEFVWPLISCQDPACLACQDNRFEKCLRRVPGAR